MNDPFMKTIERKMTTVKERVSRLELVTQPRITFAGKTQADSKAQQPNQVVSTFERPAIPPWRDPQPSDGVMQPVLWQLAEKLTSFEDYHDSNDARGIAEKNLQP
jgi:hypothetical protein